VMMALASLIWDGVVISFHWTHPPHPKFRLLKYRRFSIFTHVISGTLEIVVGVWAWFEPASDFRTSLIYIMVFASCMHATTGAYQTPQVFGIPVVMVPAYTMMIILKVFFAMRLFMSPLDLTYHQSLFFTHHIYVWCRAFTLTFEAMGIFEEYMYSQSILLAGLVCGPCMFGPSANLLVISGIAIFGLGVLPYASPQKQLEWKKERRMNLYLSPLFISKIDEIRPKISRAEHKRDKARVVFEVLADGDELIEFHDLSPILQTFGVSDLEIQSVFKQTVKKSKHGSAIDFETFYQDLVAIWARFADDQFLNYSAKRASNFQGTLHKQATALAPMAMPEPFLRKRAVTKKDDSLEMQLPRMSAIGRQKTKWDSKAA